MTNRAPPAWRLTNAIVASWAIRALISPVLGGLAIKMIVDLGVQNTFGQRLLQLVEQAVLIENLLRIAAIQKLVQRVFPDRPRHPPSALLWPRTQDS